MNKLYKQQLELLPKNIYENNFFQKSDIGCVVYSFNNKTLDQYVISKIEDLEIDKDFCIEGKVIQLLRTLNKDFDVEINQKLKVSCENINFESALLTEPKQKLEYNIDFPYELELNTNDLKQALDFVGTNEARPILTGVNVNTEGEIISTDSFIIYASLVANSNTNITIPKDFLINTLKEIDEEKITVSFDGTKCMIKNKNQLFISNLINGNYPNAKPIIIKGNKSVNIDYESLKQYLSIIKNLSQEIACIDFVGSQATATTDLQNYTQKLNITGDVNDFNFCISLSHLQLLIKNYIAQNITIYFEDYNKPISTFFDNKAIIILPLIRR